jgi:hypothetical protein
MRSKAFRVGGNGKCDEGKGIIRIKQEGKTKKGKRDPRMGEGGDPLTKFKKKESFYVGCFQHP